MKQKKIRILFVTSGLGSGGAENILYLLFKGINREKVKLMVLCLSKQKEYAEAIKILDINVLFFDFTSIINILRSIIEFRPHIIQGWMYHGNFIAFFLKFLLGKKTNVFFSIRNAGLKKSKNNMLTRLIINLGSLMSYFVKTVIYPSRDSIKNHIKLGYNADNAKLIHNGTNTQLFKNKEKKKCSSPFLVGIVARYHPVKGYEVLIEAANILKEKGIKNFTCVCYGKNVTYENQLLSQLIESYGLKHHFKLLEFHNKLDTVMPNFDVLVCPSLSESFPNVLIEAMACEVPVIATDEGESSFIVKDTGFIIPSSNPEALAKSLEKFFVLSFEERQILGKKARSRVERMFTVEKMISAYEKTYEYVRE